MNKIERQTTHLKKKKCVHNIYIQEKVNYLCLACMNKTVNK